MITRTSSGVTAVTVALRGAFESSAISPTKLPGPSVATFRPLRVDVDLALDDDEELAAALTLLDQHLAVTEVELVCDLRDALQVLLRAVLEQRRALDQIELGIRPECHRADSTAGARVRAVGRKSPGLDWFAMAQAPLALP